MRLTPRAGGDVLGLVLVWRALGERVSLALSRLSGLDKRLEALAVAVVPEWALSL